AAARRAEELKNPAVEPEHLILAVLSQEDGIVPRVLERMQASVGALEQDLERRLRTFPTVTGGGVRVVASSGLQKVFEGAEKLAKSMGDSFISTEHFLLAALREGGELARIFERQRVNATNFQSTLTELRGHQKVTDDSPETKFDVLAKYARDLTELAE